MNGKMITVNLIWLFCVLTTRLSGQEAVVLSSQDFGSCGPIDSAINDVSEVEDALVRAGYQVKTFVSDEQPILKPGLFSWCNTIVQSDSAAQKNLMVYYRGHLLTGPKEKLGLSDAKGNPNQPKIYLSNVIRRLVGCLRNGGQATLFLDVGGGANDKEVRDKLNAMMPTLRIPNKASITILAAIQNRENLIWEKRNLSHAAYWFSRALKYDAEASTDGKRVTQAALARFLNSKLQGRAAIVTLTAGRHHSIPIVQRKSRTVSEMLADVSDEISTLAHQNEVKALVFPDFEISKGSGNELEKNYGVLARDLLGRIKKNLLRRTRLGGFEVANQESLRNNLRKWKITPTSLKTERIKRLNLKYPENTMVVFGSLFHGSNADTARKSNQLELSFQPTSTKGELFPSISGRGKLSEAEWATISINSYVNTEVAEELGVPMPVRTYTHVLAQDTDGNSKSQRQPSFDIDDDPTAAPVELPQPKKRDRVIRYQRNSSPPVDDAFAPLYAEEHPMLDPKFPFRIGLIVGGGDNIRTPEFSEDRRRMLVPLQLNDEYAIVVKNFSGHPVFVRLLVDGLNTLPDFPSTKPDPDDRQFDIFTTNFERLTPQPAQPASLRSARCWFFDHTSADNFYKVKGFVTDVLRLDNNVAKFTVTDAQLSEAWKKGVRDQVGVITAAFYMPQARTERSMSTSAKYATAMGRTDTQQLKIYEGEYEAGECLGVLHLHYGF